jgi:hypothetical protein
MASSLPWRSTAASTSALTSADLVTAAAVAQDRFHHLLARRGVDVVHEHLGALGRKPLGDAFADAAAGTGHDDGFVLDAHGFCLLERCSGAVYRAMAPSAPRSGCRFGFSRA